MSLPGSRTSGSATRRLVARTSIRHATSIPSARSTCGDHTATPCSPAGCVSWRLIASRVEATGPAPVFARGAAPDVRRVEMRARASSKGWILVGVAAALGSLDCSSGKGGSGGFNSSGTDDDGGNGSASGTSVVGSTSGGTGSGSGGSTNGSSGSSSSSGGVEAGSGASSGSGSTGGSGSSGLGSSDSGATVTCPAAPGGAPANAVTAYTVLNQIRVPAGSGCMNLVADLDTSAQDYCSYEAANSGNQSCVATAHTEVMGCTGFTGADVQTREVAAGYPQSLAYTEVATTFGNDPTAAVPSWINTVFHRIPLLDPWTVDMGYGGATGCDAMDIGRGMSSIPTSAVVV